MNIENFNRLAGELQESRTLIIVEGKKDKSALEEVGFENIITLSKKPIYQVVEDLTALEVAILTDLDQEGKKLYHALAEGCQRRGIKVNNRLRLFLFRETELRQIEGLTTFIRRAEEKRSRKNMVDHNSKGTNIMPGC